ncbi:MAG: sugar O-acetyltransferase [Bacteroidales bacterium]|nr:sugar O-acetyltransferase [Bacteroidales bacterium]
METAINIEFEKEWAKMLAGEKYDAAHPGFMERLQKVRVKLWEFNSLSPDRVEERDRIIRGLLGSCGERLHINQPFRCDFGCNIHVGDNFFANFNLTVLDEAKVTIGRNCFIGPNVSIYTACHPLEAEERNTIVEWAEPVTIGDNVWIGGSATILPGVTIGDNAVIGAGSVVTRDVDASCAVGGNPARLLKRI